ncbi:hypothetical protein AC578_736 [Pseudocercospora eumusae]|uniref:Uncharacterized protein n=1 Tax=Pseudocercospora eumusae TaxID=321146 RepID=A0A139HMS0_9PEZI|nr:hypothetical protein AC578_736 [Pseudocercospora eumusae]
MTQDQAFRCQYQTIRALGDVLQLMELQPFASSNRLRRQQLDFSYDLALESVSAHWRIKDVTTTLRSGWMLQLPLSFADQEHSDMNISSAPERAIFVWCHSLACFLSLETPFDLP